MNLAIIDDAEGRASVYESALVRASKACPKASKTRLADYSANTQRIVKDETGRDLEVLEILRQATKSVPASMRGKIRCGDVFAALVAIMTAP